MQRLMHIAPACLLLACGQEAPTPIDFTAAAGHTEEALMISSELAGFAAARFATWGLPRAGLVFSCDPEPEVGWTQVCGRDVPTEVTLAWDACSGMRQEATSSGSLHVVNSFTPSSEACDDDTVLSIAHDASFELSITGPRDYTISETGTVSASGSRSLSGPAMEMAVTTHLSRSLTNAEGRSISATLSGSHTTVFDHATDPATATSNGTQDVEIDGARGAHAIAVTITDLVRVAPAVCRYPVSGTLLLVRDELSRSVVFGPECGQASIDGEALTLPLDRQCQRLDGERRDRP